MTLVFAGLFGGLLKVQLDEVAAFKRKREDAASFVTNVLADLKGVFDQVARARILIPAHQSVATYGDEMRALIMARVQLRNVVRALERRADGIDEESNDTRQSEGPSSLLGTLEYCHQLATVVSHAARRYSE